MNYVWMTLACVNVLRKVTDAAHENCDETEACGCWCHRGGSMTTETRVECSTCGGNGLDDYRTPGGHWNPSACPDCVDGLAPPDCLEAAQACT